MCASRGASSCDESKSDRDVFKEKPYRYLGYANEIGESFRHVVSRTVVNGSYGMASCYVIAHALYMGTKEDRKMMAICDTLLWQGFASVIIPGVTINRVCATSKWLLNKSKAFPSPMKPWVVIGVGLVTIPVIISPIDRFVDETMDRLVRPYYGNIRTNI